MAEITAVEYTCDGCVKSDIRSVDDEEPVGFHGTVRQVTPSGGSATTTWWACRPKCITPAIKAAVDEGWN